jgi:oligopeptide transport system ATP-binding protein
MDSAMPLIQKTDNKMDKSELKTPLLNVKNLKVEFSTREGAVCAVNDISLKVMERQTIGIVGESGSGKSQTFMSIMGLLANNGKASGSVQFEGTEILNMPVKALNKIRGSKLSMIFQDPMTCLNPYMSIGRQLTEVLTVHTDTSRGEAKRIVIEMLGHVRIPEPERRFKMYPHEFSGGMRQRVMIAMALLCSPSLLIADEPTTALDVTVQAQVIDLLKNLRKELGTSIIMITHDLGVVAGTCDFVFVMYGGQIVESGPVRDIFYNPQHPYTQSLLKAMPRVDEGVIEKLETIPGQPPNLLHLPKGCNFAPRCPHRMQKCIDFDPVLEDITETRKKACHLEEL